MVSHWVKFSVIFIVAAALLLAAFLSNLFKDHILLSKDNVVFTPHIAFYSKESLERILQTTIENIAAFVSGNPQNVLQSSS